MDAYINRARNLLKELSYEKRCGIVKNNRIAIQAKLKNKNDYQENGLLKLKMDTREKTCKALIDFLAEQYYVGARNLDEDLKNSSSSFG